MKFRHEFKHYLNYSDYLTIRNRLNVILERDAHADEHGAYKIRSLYFDNYQDKVLREKLDGVDKREKFRIRCYNDTYDIIHLEKKSKINGLCSKESVEISAVQVKAILENDTSWMTETGQKLLVELYSKMKSQVLRPKTIVDYIREPFVFPAGNVRITLDRNVSSGLHCTDFFNTKLPVVPAGECSVLLEVKYDAFLPEFIMDIIQTDNRRASAFSKYAACRIYG